MSLSSTRRGGFRLIEGEYFRIDQMLSSDYETKVQINKKEFLNCIDRATLFVKEGDKKPIIINIQDGGMELSIHSQIGSMKEDIDIAKEGKDIMIGFNPDFSSTRCGSSMMRKSPFTW